VFRPVRLPARPDSNAVPNTATDGNSRIATDGNSRVATDGNSVTANSNTCSPDSDAHNSTYRYQRYGKVCWYKVGEHYYIRWNGIGQHADGR